MRGRAPNAGLEPCVGKHLLLATSATSNARRLLDRATALLTAHKESGDVVHEHR